jgi:hypothetical protein
MRKARRQWMDFFDLTAYLTAFFFIVGGVYRYISQKSKRSKISFTNLLFLLGVSFITALGISYIVGYFDLLFNSASILGFDEGSLKLPAFLGAGVILLFAVQRYLEFLKKNGKRRH